MKFLKKLFKKEKKPERDLAEFLMDTKSKELQDMIGRAIYLANLDQQKMMEK